MFGEEFAKGANYGIKYEGMIFWNPASKSMAGSVSGVGLQSNKWILFFFFEKKNL